MNGQCLGTFKLNALSFQSKDEGFVLLLYTEQEIFYHSLSFLLFTKQAYIK